MKLLSWDLTALISGLDARAELAERNLWLTRLLAWLRHNPIHGRDQPEADPQATPLAVLRLKHFLNMLERNPQPREALRQVMDSFWQEMDTIGLFAEVGFAPRAALWSEFFERLRLKLIPSTPDTTDLGELFSLLFPEPDDVHWMADLDDATLARLADVFAPQHQQTWRKPLMQAILVLVSRLRATGLSGPLRRRMSLDLLRDEPFEQLARAAERVLEPFQNNEFCDEAPKADLHYLRTLLAQCRSAVMSVPDHLEAHGVSINIVFEVQQMLARSDRLEALLNCLVSPQPQREMLRLTTELVAVVHQRNSIRTLFARHYSLLARKVAERGAETGEHYITRDRSEYADMLHRALGGGVVIVLTTFLKFGILALGLAAFWSGFVAGLNYATCFVAIHLAHWTVATKQPAMTAPAMAAKLGHVESDKGLTDFVDEVANLLRSQMAGIVGNLAAVFPIVLAVQLLSRWLFGQPLVGVHSAEHTLETLTLWGPTLVYAAFTGILLFASSLIAGWAENWFVLHRLESALAYHPRVTDLLGVQRARRWALWWRQNISGLAANISLGMMLGLVPVILSFFGIPLDVRHVTLSTGQLAAAMGALGVVESLQTSALWWCLASIPFIGMLNLSVSFLLAFKVALRSRGIALKDRARVRRAIWQRLRTDPRSFLLPPKKIRA